MYKFLSYQARLRRLLRMEEPEISRDARRRLQWFIYCLEHESNVSLTCRYFGIARSTFLRWANRFDPLDPQTLEEHSRRPKHFRQPETPEATVSLIKSLREKDPHISRKAIVETLRTLHSIQISEASVGRVIRRYALFFADTPSHARKRREIEPLSLGISEYNESLQDNAQSRPDENGGLSFAPSAILLVLVAFASLAAGFLTDPDRAFAADSDSFQINNSIGNNSDAAGSTSESFQIDNASLTWSESTGEGDSYGFGESDSDEDDGGGDTGGTDGASTGGGSGSRGGGSGSGGGRNSGTGRLGDTGITDGTQSPLDGITGAPVKPTLPSAPSAAPSVPANPIAPKAPVATVSKAVSAGLLFATPKYFNVSDPVVYKTIVETRESQEQEVHRLAADADSLRRDIALLFMNFLTFTMLVVTYIHIRIGMFASMGLDILSFLRPGFVKVSTPKKLSAKHVIKRKLRQKKTTRFFHKRVLSIALLAGFAAGTLGHIPVTFAEVTVPQKIIYNGQLKNGSGQKIITNHIMRFSFWSDSDAVPEDLLGDGSIDITRPNYAGWQEVHLIKPNNSGYFSLNLGSGTALPAFSDMSQQQLMNLHMQVEVKQVGQPDTSFQIMDVNPSPVLDRTPVRSVPFALNADLLDQRDTGTGSGNIAVLGSGGVFDIAHIPGGTNSGNFTIDFNNTETSEISLTFGDSIGKSLSYSIPESLFNFDDDVRIQGDLTVTGVINGIDISTLVSPEIPALKVSSGAGLNVNVAVGSYRINGDITNFPGQGNVVLNDDTTNYLFFGSGGLTISTIGLPSDESAIPLATVVTSGGSITSVADRRVLQNDDRERSVSEHFSAAFEHVVFQGDAGDNVGQMSEQHDSINLKNYYQWTSTVGTLQDYDIIVRVPLSEDFVGWIDNPLHVQYRATTVDNANAKLDITVFDTNGNPVILSGATTNLTGTSWATSQIEFLGSPTWTPATKFLIKFKVSAKENFQIHLGGFLLKFRELITN